MGHSICFCTTCRVMFCDPDSIELEGLSIQELLEVEDLDYGIDDVENDGKLFFSKCPVCRVITVMYRYESHAGGAGA